ncbi:MAG: VWA domain-containing protein [Planctomycetota bacterium]|jgi:hypothetical protein
MNDKAKSSAEKDRTRRGRSFGRYLIYGLGGALGIILLSLLIASWLLDHYVDGFNIHQPSRKAEVREILWEPPEPLAGMSNLPLDHYEPVMSWDGLSLIFARGKAGENADLFHSQWDGKEWSAPQPMEAINTPSDELGPELSRDGRFLIFYSDRPGGIGGYDIWISRFDGETWNAPENPGEVINSEFNEYGPGLSPDGGRLFFSSNRLERELTPEEREAWQATLRENFLESDYDIFTSVFETGDPPTREGGLPPMPHFDGAERLEALNSPADEGQVALTPRGDFIYFSSNRHGGLGRFDLYRARILHGEVQEPINLGEPVNSFMDDMDPFLSSEGYRLMFSSNRVERDGARRYELYQTFSREVFSQKDYSALVALLRALDKIKWPLLLFLLALLALLLLLRYLKSQRFVLQPSLLEKCLLLSLLLHLLLALLTSTVMVSYGLYDLAMEGSDELFVSMDALAEEGLGLEIREEVADLESIDEDLPMAVQQELLVAERTFSPQDLEEEPFNPIPLSRDAAWAPPEQQERIETARPLDPIAFDTALDPLPIPESVPSREMTQAGPAEETSPMEQPELVQDQGPQALNLASLEPERMELPAELAHPELQEGSSLVEEGQDPSLDQALTEAHTLPDIEADLAVDGYPEGGLGEMELPVVREDESGEDPLRLTVPALAKAPVRSENMQRPVSLEKTPINTSAIPEASLERKPALVRNDPASAQSSSLSKDVLPPAKIRTAMDWEDPVKSMEREMPEEMKKKELVKSESAGVPALPIEMSPTDRNEDLAVSKRVARAQPEMSWKESPTLPRKSMLSENRPNWKVTQKPNLSSSPKAVYILPETERTLQEGTMDFMPPQADRSKEESRKLLALNLPSDAPRPLDAPRSETRRPLESPTPEIAAKPSRTSALLPSKPMRFEETIPLIKPYEHEAPPTYFGIEIAHRKIIFCLDVSGSMEWNNRIEDARQELLRLLDTLDGRVEFNILTFSGRARIWNRRGVQPADSENLDSAKRFVRRARIASDGTNTVDALTAALSDEDVECIYLLSDGHPTVGFTTDARRILRHVEELQQDRNVIIHTIAYIKGDPPRDWRDRVPPKSRLIYLMEQLAERNGGHCVVFDDQ